MSYRAYDIVRLHGRDLIFRGRYLWKKILGTSPKYLVFCNSYPKSGTHLLYQILYTLPKLKKWDDIVSVQALCGIMNTSSHIKWKVGSAQNSSIIRSHLMYCEETQEILHKFHCKLIFIYRDLRDVAVSHARWVRKEPRIFLHHHYLNLDSFEEQLMCSIKGLPLGTPFGSNISQPDIGQDFSRWLGWINEDTALAIKFEDLVGERGGGLEETRIKTIRDIAHHLEIDLSLKEIESHFSSVGMNPEESHTFRKGRIGGWKEYFKPEHKKAFKQVAGDLLIRLGYESDLDW